MRFGSNKISIFRKTPVEEMEYDILMAAYELGKITLSSKAGKRLVDKYKGDEMGLQLRALLLHLRDERLLVPAFDGHGQLTTTGESIGITPKGVSRLRELDSPYGAWLAKNWFPLGVALSTLLVTSSGIAVTFLVGVLDIAIAAQQSQP